MTWENFAGCFDDYHVFCEVHHQCAQDFNCLVIDQTSPHTGIEQQCFFWKATERLPPFRLGNKQYWLGKRCAVSMDGSSSKSTHGVSFCSARHVLRSLGRQRQRQR